MGESRNMLQQHKEDTGISATNLLKLSAAARHNCKQKQSDITAVNYRMCSGHVKTSKSRLVTMLASAARVMSSLVVGIWQHVS